DRRVAAIFPFTMSNSAVFFVPAARWCARVLLVLCSIHPMRGERSAERRRSSVVALVTRDGPRLARRGARPAGRARLSAPRRGDFGPGAALPSPALPPDPCSELLAARSLCLAGGVPGLLGPTVTSRGRRTPLPAPPSARPRGRPLRSPPTSH